MGCVAVGVVVMVDVAVMVGVVVIVDVIGSVAVRLGVMEPGMGITSNGVMLGEGLRLGVGVL
jgi:hypothetical protein